MAGTSDLLVVVLSHKPTMDISTKNGPTKLKKISVTDASKCEVELSIWGEAMTSFFDGKTEELDNHAVIAIMGAGYKNHDQWGRQLQTNENTKVYVNPTNIRSLTNKICELKSF